MRSAKRQMDDCEIWAKEYLVFCGFNPNDVVFEPDGNVTPDFLVERRIAVEVRRLNKHWEAASGDLVPLEKLERPFLAELNRCLDSYGNPVGGTSWCVFPLIKRPQLTRNWAKLLRTELGHFAKGEVYGNTGTISIDENLKFRLERRSQPGERTFTLAGIADSDHAGWVGDDLCKNLQICIDEKSAKIATRKPNYSIWWLILVDHIMGGRPGSGGPPEIDHDWNKVIVIHPADYNRAYEIRSPKSSGD